MKATLVNTLILILSVRSTSAQKERLFPQGDGDRLDTSENNVISLGGSQPHFDLPEEVDISSSASNDEIISNDEDIASRAYIQGRTEPSSECEDGNSRHYEKPCDDNVVSKATNGSTDSISGRNPNLPSEPSSDESSLDESSSSSSSSSSCVTTDGTFGNISDSTALLMVPLHYFYEMKTATSTNLSKIDNEILPLLEKAIVDSILQEVFPDKCKSTAIGKRQLRESRNKRHLEIVGVSMYPPDYVTVHCK